MRACLPILCVQENWRKHQAHFDVAFDAELLTVWLNVVAVNVFMIIKFSQIRSGIEYFVIGKLTHFPLTAFIAPNSSFSSFTVML